MLVTLPENVAMNVERYCELLLEHIIPCMVKRRANQFQQDEALCHTNKTAKDLLDFCRVKYIKDWPGNIPDLNPI